MRSVEHDEARSNACLKGGRSVPRVWVGMSGGVDSSVAAALLVEAGYDVVGVTMQLWPSHSAEGGCCSVSAVRDARRVCDALGIAHYSLNYRDAFERHVVGPFCAEYALGRTPNPCITCNDRLKFSDLLAKAMTNGADFLATGHYARIVRDSAGEAWLARAADESKDQSYFLYRLTPMQLRHTLFPLGDLTKVEVREIARRLDLPTAAKEESQDTCFAVAGDHATIVASRIPEAAVPGPVVDSSGRVIGRHAGVAHYTIGQRKGLGILAERGPWYVIGIDSARNRLIVGPRESLRALHVVARDIVWRGETESESSVMVRYRMSPVPARCFVAGDMLDVHLAVDIGAVAPGQSVVCYRDEVVIGGGVIECAS